MLLAAAWRTCSGYFIIFNMEMSLRLMPENNRQDLAAVVSASIQSETKREGTLINCRRASKDSQKMGFIKAGLVIYWPERRETCVFRVRSEKRHGHISTRNTDRYPLARSSACPCRPLFYTVLEKHPEKSAPFIFFFALQPLTFVPFAGGVANGQPQHSQRCRIRAYFFHERVIM